MSYRPDVSSTTIVLPDSDSPNHPQTEGFPVHSDAFRPEVEQGLIPDHQSE
jgi:hypothetical protein